MTIVYQNGIPGKICANPECGWKPLSEFHQRRILGIPAGDGYKSRCKECWNTQGRAERNARLEHYRTRQQKYVETNKDHYRDLKRAHQKAHPEKYDEALRKYRE